MGVIGRWAMCNGKRDTGGPTIFELAEVKEEAKRG